MKPTADDALLADAFEDDEGELVATIDGTEVRESRSAGAYYCAHALHVISRWARSSPDVLVDADGDPLVGFLHVPIDVEAAGAVERVGRERHRATIHVLAAALRGTVDGTQERRVLLSGFGPFAAVASNPTGDLVGDDACMSELLELACGEHPTDLPPIEDGAGFIARQRTSSVTLGRLRLMVDDRALDPAQPGSLPWALARFQPHAVISLGVHRASTIFRVEIEPTDEGLVVDEGAPRHDKGRPASARGPVNRALARAIARGARPVLV